jgi:hypothetical protein
MKGCPPLRSWTLKELSLPCEAGEGQGGGRQLSQRSNVYDTRFTRTKRYQYSTAANIFSAASCTGTSLPSTAMTPRGAGTMTPS